MKYRNKDKGFYGEMISIALPITLQNLIASSVNMLDTLMITSLGQESLAAVGLANQVFFFYAVTIFGVATGSSVFISQFWGKKDIKNIRKIIGLSLTISGIIGVIFTLGGLLIPDRIMMIFSKDIEVIELGSEYLRIVAFSYIITGFSSTYAIASRSIGQAKMPMVVSLVSFVSNGVLNYLFIFGKLGFPALGIKGAAYGTLIARLIEIVLILYSIYSDDGPLAGNLKEMTQWNKDFAKRYFNTAYPVIISEALWSLGTVFYSIAYAKIGTEATAAVQILNTVQNVFMVMTRGLANACTVMVGSRIGAGEEDLAIDYANRFLRLSVVLGLGLGGILYFGSDVILKVFRNLTPELYATSKKSLTVLSLFFFIKVFNATMMVGVFRGGGDTKFSMLLEMGAVWFVGVPLAFLGATVFKLPLHQVLVLVYMDEAVTAIVGLPRIVSKKWVKNVIQDMG